MNRKVKQIGFNLYDFLHFIRFERCFFYIFPGILGFLLFNNLSMGVLSVAVVSFLAIAGGCAYNNITDLKEDKINRSTVSRLSSRKLGIYLTLLMYTLGFVVSLTMSPVSIIFYLAMVFPGIAYSYYRVKASSLPLTKNLYASFVLAFPFFIGAGFINVSVFLSYLIVGFIVLTSSFLSDLNDFKGDKKFNIRTIPVRFGYNKGKYAVLSVIIVSLLLTILYSQSLLPLVVLPVISVFILVRNNIKITQILVRSTFPVSALWYLIVAL